MTDGVRVAAESKKARTVFKYLLIHNPLYTNGALNGRKELGLFVLMMLRDTRIPRQTILDEVGIIASRQTRCQLVDGIKTTDERVVGKGHMGCHEGEGIILQVDISHQRHVLNG